MKNQKQLLLLIVTTSLFVHMLSATWLAIPIAGALLFSLLVTWTLPRPARYLVVLAIALEALSTNILGLGTAAAATPLLVRLLLPRLDVDISLKYFFVLFVTVVTQVLLLAAPDLYSFQTLPLYRFLTATLLVSFLGFVTTILFANRIPLQQRSVISLEGHRLHD